jgi:hypothetical protein
MRRLWMRLTADRKRFVLLCTALVVGMLLWGRMIVLTNVPRTAVANEEGQAIGSRQRSEHGVPRSESSTRNSELRQPTAVHIHLDALPNRDPFVISNEHFPKPVVESPSPPDQGKSPADVVESEEAREARLMAVLGEAVSRLRLEAVMMGSQGSEPMVVINGRTYRRGDVITISASPTDAGGLGGAGRRGDRGGAGAGNRERPDIRFRLVEVEQRSAVLDFDGRRFELNMATTF